MPGLGTNAPIQPKNLLDERGLPSSDLPALFAAGELPAMGSPPA